MLGEKDGEARHAVAREHIGIHGRGRRFVNRGNGTQHHDLLRGAAQLRAEFDVASEVPVAFIDLTQRMQNKLAEHDGRAAGALDRDLFAARSDLQRHIGVGR